MIYKLRLSSWGLLLLALLNTSHELSWRVSQEVRALSEPPAVDRADLEVILYGCTKSQKGETEKWRQEG